MDVRADARGVSVDAFWMDETEVTNSEYKQFVYWVRDSIIRERLADPAYGGNDEFRIEEGRDDAARRNRLNPARRNYNTDLPVSDEVPQITKDTAYVDDDGTIVRRTITRGLTGDYDFINTYIVNVYPDTTGWVKTSTTA